MAASIRFLLIAFDILDNKRCCAQLERFAEWASCSSDRGDRRDRKPAIAPHKNPAPRAPCRNKTTHHSHLIRCSSTEPCCRIELRGPTPTVSRAATYELAANQAGALAIWVKSRPERALHWHRYYPRRQPGSDRAVLFLSPGQNVGALVQNSLR